MPILLKNRSLPNDKYESDLYAIDKACFFVPLLSHTLVDPESVASYLISLEFELIDAVIITSQKAVNAITDHIDTLPEHKQVTLLSKPVYTVGPATAGLLQSYGFTDVRGADNAGNGSILADIILNDVENFGLKSFVFFTGKTRRDIIPLKLNQSPAVSLIEKVVYETGLLDNTRSQFVNTVDRYVKEHSTTPWIVFFAPSGTEHIVAELKTLPADSYRIAAIGPTTEAYLKDNGLAPSAVAEKPTSEHLLKAMFGF